MKTIISNDFFYFNCNIINRFEKENEKLKARINAI